MSASTCRLIFLLALFVSPALGQNSRPPKIRLTIEKATATPTGYEVHVGIKNVGEQPLILHLASPQAPQRAGVPPQSSPRVLQSLDVQQFDDKLGWQSVGPCRDVVGEETTTLKPGEELSNVVPIGDTSHGWNNAVCPRKIAHIGGKIRAILYFAYQSEEQFRRRDRRARVDVVSAPIEIPPLAPAK
jgi:hypothetical protein